MDEAERLADRIAVLAAGQIVAEGTPRTLGGRRNMAATIRFTLPDGLTSSDLPAFMSALVRVGRRGDTELSTEDPLLHLAVLTRWAYRRGVDLPDLEVRRPTLEEVYLMLTALPAQGPR